VIVHQVLCAAGPVDAVTNQALAWRRQFDAWGWGGEDYAEVLAPGMERLPVKPLTGYAPGEPTLVHYSGWADTLERRLGSRFMVLSHNITPPQFFWELEPAAAVGCALAPAQLARLVERADVAAGVSAFNAADFGGEVVPILFDRDRLSEPAAPSGPPTVLFVGRLAPHKRHDLVIRAFALYRRRAPEARLVLVGVPISPDYDARMRRLADEVVPGAVTFANGIPAAELHEHYRAAHAFLCLSEHEGFCIPLLEAFHFGVPVIARAVGGIPDVVGDAGVLLGPDDGLGVVAELLDIAVTSDLRETVRPRAEARLDHYAAPRVAALMHEHLTSL
jgi:glycosyltransferase involved in cell wall biosynthesis